VTWFEVESDRFDHTSELPQDMNAGNRFYGRDVASLIADGLAACGYTSGIPQHLRASNGSPPYR
jgi:hypothetical protein